MKLTRKSLLFGIFVFILIGLTEAQTAPTLTPNAAVMSNFSTYNTTINISFNASDVDNDLNSSACSVGGNVASNSSSGNGTFWYSGQIGTMGRRYKDNCTYSAGIDIRCTDTTGRTTNTTVEDGNVVLPCINAETGDIPITVINENVTLLNVTNSDYGVLWMPRLQISTVNNGTYQHNCTGWKIRISDTNLSASDTTEVVIKLYRLNNSGGYSYTAGTNPSIGEDLCYIYPMTTVGGFPYGSATLVTIIGVVGYLEYRRRKRHTQTGR